MIDQKELIGLIIKCYGIGLMQWLPYFEPNQKIGTDYKLFRDNYPKNFNFDPKSGIWVFNETHDLIITYEFTNHDPTQEAKWFFVNLSEIKKAITDNNILPNEPETYALINETADRRLVLQCQKIGTYKAFSKYAKYSIGEIVENNGHYFILEENPTEIDEIADLYINWRQLVDSDLGTIIPSPSGPKNPGKDPKGPKKEKNPNDENDENKNPWGKKFVAWLLTIGFIAVIVKAFNEWLENMKKNKSGKKDPDDSKKPEKPGKDEDDQGIKLVDPSKTVPEAKNKKSKKDQKVKTEGTKESWLPKLLWGLIIALLVFLILFVLGLLFLPHKKDNPPPPPQDTTQTDTGNKGGTDNNQGGADGQDQGNGGIQDQGNGNDQDTGNKDDSVNQTVKLYSTEIIITLEDYSTMEYTVKTKKPIQIPNIPYTAELSDPKYYPTDQWVQIWTPDKKTLLVQCRFVEAVPKNQ